jgi:uncharacterized membrane protein
MLPPWDGFHPLLVHFPIVCFVFAPFVLSLALIKADWRQPLLMATLTLLAVGTVFAFLTVSAGEAAEHVAHFSPAAKAVLEEHSEGGETVRNLFTAITLLLAGIMFGPRLIKKIPGRKLEMGLYLLVLALCLAGALILTNVADKGGRLVHVYGIHARMHPGSPPVEYEHD